MIRVRGRRHGRRRPCRRGAGRVPTGRDRPGRRHAHTRQRRRARPRVRHHRGNRQRARRSGLGGRSGEGRWDVRLAEGIRVDPSRFQRNFYATSSCGVCGKASIDAIRVAGSVPPHGPVVTPDVLLGLPGRLIERAACFSLDRRDPRRRRIRAGRDPGGGAGGRGGTMRWTSWSVISPRPAGRSTSSACWSRAGSRSRSCRRQRWPGSHWSAGSRQLPASPSTSLKNST